ncbi:hypothetical protein O3P69_016166, partial [Scylla paramamosain]
PGVPACLLPHLGEGQPAPPRPASARQPLHQIKIQQINRDLNRVNSVFRADRNS